jgi:DNA-binding NtrC family response regulator
MNNEKHILVITDDENSDIVRLLFRHRIIPITKRSILSAIYVLQHLDIVAVIIDKELQNVDTLEFILNARDIDRKVPIFVSNSITNQEDWKIIKNESKVVVFKDENDLIKNTVNKIDIN